jgi:hypothetical protein
MKNLGAAILFSVISILVFTAQTCKQNQKTQPCVEKINNDCMCPENYKPVCGCNKKTYSNECFAKCGGITEFTEGECPK